VRFSLEATTQNWTMKTDESSAIVSIVAFSTDVISFLSYAEVAFNLSRLSPIWNSPDETVFFAPLS
jgi:hypothetical protein